MSEVIVRALHPNDWETYRAVRLKALKENPSVYLSSYDQEVNQAQDWWSGTLDGKGKMVFCLFDGVEAVGLAGVFTWRGDVSGQSAVMAMDYVDARYRGRGLSRLLYQSRIDWAASQPQFMRLVISHREGNEASRRANQAFGFVFTGRERIMWPDGKEDWEYNYELDLAGLR